MSKIYVDEIAGIASPSTVAIPGHVIQTAHIIGKTTLESTSFQTWLDIGGMSITFTPKSSSSTLLVTAATHMFLERIDGGWTSGTTRIVVDGNAQTAGGGSGGESAPYGVAIRGTNVTDQRIMGYDVKSCEYSVSSTSPIIVKVQAYAYQLQSNYNIRANAYGEGYIQIQEIAG